MTSQPCGETVWLINQYAVTPDSPGITRHFELAQYLNQFGWRTSVYATSFNHYRRAPQRPATWTRPHLQTQEDGVDFHWLYSLPYQKNDWRRYANVLSFAAILLVTGLRGPSPDIIIGSSPHPLTGLVAWILSKRHRARFVFEVRDLWPEQLVQMGSTGGIVLRTLDWTVGFLYRNAAHVISLSDGITKGLIERGVDPLKVSMIPNAPSIPCKSEPNVRRMIRASRHWEDRTVLIYAGSHNPSYDLENIVEAARMTQDQPQLLWVLVGDGSEKESLKRASKDLRNIQFLDPVPQSQILSLLSAADIGLLTRPKHDVFAGIRPVKMLEYMAAKLPILSTMEGEVEELLRISEAGMTIHPASPTDLANGAVALSEDATLREQLGTQGHNFMIHHFTRERTARELSCLLGRVLDESTNADRHSP